MALAACSAGPPTPTRPAPSGEPSQNPIRTSAAATEPSEPTAANGDIDGLSALQCDGEPSALGGGAPLGAESGGDSPDEALAALLEDDFVIPRQGYDKLEEDEDEVLYTYVSNERVKVAAVVTNIPSADFPDGWHTDELRACEATEYGAEADLGPGYEPWVHPDGRVLWAIDDSAHCWDSATLLRIAKRLYVRDPKGVVGADNLVKPFDDDATLPDDAVDTTYRKGNRELWAVPDRSAVYNVGPNKTELWPRATDDLGCT
jgi:hypothetical protein